MCFVLHKGQLSWRRVREQDNLNCFGQMLSEHLGSQYMGSLTPVHSQIKEKNITSEEEDTGFCSSEYHMEEDKPQHFYEQKDTKIGQKKK